MKRSYSTMVPLTMDDFDHRQRLDRFLRDDTNSRSSKVDVLQRYMCSDIDFINVAYYSMLCCIGSKVRGECEQSLVTVVAPLCSPELLEDAIDYFKDKKIYKNIVEQLRIFLHRCR